MNDVADTFDEFLDQVLVELSVGVPEFPAHMGLFEAAGSPLPQNRFTDISDSAAQDRQRTLKSLADTLAGFLPDELQTGQRISADMLAFFFDFVHERDWIGLKGKDFLRHEYLIRPSVGLQSDLPLFLSDLHPMRHGQDAHDYRDRLTSIAPLLAEARELIVERQLDGILPPRFLIQDTIREISEFMAANPRENILCKSFAEKSVSINDLSNGEKEHLLEVIGQEVHDHTYPAYAQLVETLSLQEQEAPGEPGLWRLPDGEAYYEFLLQCATTTTLTADEIHELGLAETEKLEKEIVTACRDLGYEVATIGDCYRQLDQDKTAAQAGETITRQKILLKVESLIDDIARDLPSLFHHLPNSPLTVKPIPEFAESSRNQIYQPPSLDGSRAGLFELNVGLLLASNEIDNDLSTLVYHEIFPGHHLQMALAIEMDELPLVRRIITFDSYIEGWAKYAETVPWTHGINTDPRWRISGMRRELLSTINLVVDTGIHLKRWGVRQAMEYLQQHAGLDNTFAKYLVHRSASVPAQMCSYKIGMLKVQELKNRMSSAQGASFDIRDFHDVILRNGAVPLALLERIVDEEIQCNAG